MKAPPPTAPSLDWEAVRRRLAATQTALAGAGLPSPERQRQLLKERALALAQPLPEPPAADQIELVAFQLGPEQYGIESLFLREIILAKALVPLTTAPAFVAGIINVRGQILSVIDLKQLFDLPPTPLPDPAAIFILRSEAMEFGLLTDGLLGLRQLPRRQLQRRPPAPSGAREDYLLGITPEPLIVLDGAKLLSDRKLIVYEEVTL